MLAKCSIIGVTSLWTSFASIQTCFIFSGDTWIKATFHRTVPPSEWRRNHYQYCVIWTMAVKPVLFCFRAAQPYTHTQKKRKREVWPSTKTVTLSPAESKTSDYMTKNLLSSFGGNIYFPPLTSSQLASWVLSNNCFHDHKPIISPVWAQRSPFFTS